MLIEAGDVAVSATAKINPFFPPSLPPLRLCGDLGYLSVLLVRRGVYRPPVSLLLIGDVLLLTLSLTLPLYSLYHSLYLKSELLTLLYTVASMYKLSAERTENCLMDC
ncbi:hypothetical protein GUJ93_ZPchr0006g44918 [Zizania palustris]|uniref:Uncharacterized protein n=1 Tax=Zizania palustris TaxID=103762 RepID=A0A8J5TBD8_ZIZPA|nr:hypothetical protein GUJ93_ZPchr0006g44918 [Zizania palustris]